MSDLEQSRASFKKALEGLDDERALTLGSYPGKLIERVEELEQVTKRQLDTIGYYEDLTYRYRQALEFYADKKNYKTVLESDEEIAFLKMSSVQRDGGEKANKAFKEGEEND